MAMTTLSFDVTYDPTITSPEQLAEAFEILIKNSLSSNPLDGEGPLEVWAVMAADDEEDAS